MQRIKRIKFDLVSLIMMMLMLIPVIDTINGYLLKGGLSSIGIGIFYRVFFLGLIVLYIILEKITKLDTVIILSFFVFLVIQFAISESSYINDNVATTVKLFTPLLLLCAFIKMKKKSKTSETDVESLLKRLSILFPLTILIPYLMEAGYSTYRGDVGYKAFYYATNEISFSLCVMVMYLWKILRERFNIRYLIIFLLNAISCILLGSKVALGVLLFFTFLLIAENIFIANRKRIGRSIGILAFFLIALPFVINRLESAIDKVINRWIYNQQMAEDSLSFLFSHRNVFLRNGYSIFKDKGFETFLFGWGFGGKKLVEMDMFDILFGTGIIGLIVISAIYILLIKKISVSSKIGWLFIIVSTVLSFVGGHVLFSGLGGMMFALIIVYSSVIRKEREKQPTYERGK